MNSIGGKTLSPDIIGTATISGAKLFLMKDLKLIYIFQDKLIIKFYFKVTKRNANLPFLSVNFPSVCSEITSQIVCKFLQIIVFKQHLNTVWDITTKILSVQDLMWRQLFTMFEVFWCTQFEFPAKDRKILKWG